MTLRVGLVGAGTVGSKRAQAVHDDPGAELIAVNDLDRTRAATAAQRCGGPSCQVLTDWTQVATHPDVDAVIVSTVNKFLCPITIAALQAGKHVLCEKPLGRDVQEAQHMVEAARQAGKLLKTGFNHRHHPAVLQAHQLVETGEIGRVMFARCIYGHGGRPGYEKEWRGDFDLAGGGELLDQGIHVVDLLRWFLGDFTEVVGHTATYFWELGLFPQAEGQGVLPPPSKLEDNAMALLRTASGAVAVLHTSWTQWKNCFVFEVFGDKGYVRVDGLGGSYGVEQLILGRRRPESGPPDEQRWEYPGLDSSWQAEWREFTSAIREGRRPLGDAEDGLAGMQLIAAIYSSARGSQWVPVGGSQ